MLIKDTPAKYKTVIKISKYIPILRLNIINKVIFKP